MFLKEIAPTKVSLEQKQNMWFNLKDVDTSIKTFILIDYIGTLKSPKRVGLNSTRNIFTATQSFFVSPGQSRNPSKRKIQ